MLRRRFSPIRCGKRPNFDLNYKYTGKERDTESGNDDFGARYYSDNVGRFLSPDWSAKATPIPYADLSDPQSLNLYTYVHNTPVSHVDADGHFDCTGKNAQSYSCQLIAKWNKTHGITSKDSKSGYPGRTLRLPNGAPVLDPHSSTGTVTAPAYNLSDVADAGRATADSVKALGGSDSTLGNLQLKAQLGLEVGTGGEFDEQRMGPQSDVLTGGFQQYPQFRDAANVNVGLFAQQAGLSLDQTLHLAGDFAKRFSSNASPSSPYGLDPRTAEMITVGYQVGQCYFTGTK
jgi:RHS repeat-associated protein